MTREQRPSLDGDSALQGAVSVDFGPQWVLGLASLKRTGNDIALAADETVRAEVAEALGLLACGSLAIDARLELLSRGRWHLTGTLHATVTQRCIVTLEHVEEQISEPLNTIFDPALGSDAGEVRNEAGAVDVSLQDADIEPIVDERLDIGRVVVETLVVAVNPYPRVSDARLEHLSSPPGAPADDDDTGSTTSPFAVLKSLQQGGD